VRAAIEGGLAVLSITDDGAGVSTEARAHLFEPFFTTRDVGDGSGQSLAIARTMMERHHGTIELTSKPGVGATFTITIPMPIDESLWD
jgi:two-component system, NtrC family, sensor kinase